MVGKDKRPNHQFWLSLVLMAVFGVANVIFSYLNYRERTEMRREANMTREMLNARARIQIRLVAALSEGRPLTKAEITEINRLWQAAEYQFVEGESR